MVSEKDKRASDEPHIKEIITITDPSAVPTVFHKKKSTILKLLIEKEMTIIGLKHATGMNPGTIKRHLNDLLEYGLIFISKTQISEHSIVMKFYRAIAKEIKFDIKWPSR
ncbi:MAG: ArsR family transcriptional regulator [Candidatus Heimdallarchaeota archaeon]|nr:ArsR family transcriptional regulator [Candidatus Heimdallarchaeota archaeon]MCK4876236.1 ArsR family transcriptional regulator [Candidatus Heimdallarchaeota archaeon]